MPEAETFELPSDDLQPMPENGVAAVRAIREEREEPKTRSDKGKKHAPNRSPNAPPRSFEEATVAVQGRPMNEKDLWPRQWGPLWLAILAWLPSQKIGEEPATPDDVMCGVERTAGGGQTGGATLEPIEGSQIAGDDNESGDRALQRVVTDTCHLHVSHKESRATFRLRFYWRRGGGGAIATSETFTLDSPKNILLARNYRGEAPEGEVLGPLPTAMANGAPLPAGLPPEILMELGELRAKVHGKQPTVAAPAATAPVNVEAQLEVVRLQAQLQAEKDKAAEKEKAEARERDLQQQIRDLQAAKDRDAQNARFAALEARLSAPAEKTVAQQVVETLKAMGMVVPGPNGEPTVAVGAGAPGVTPMQQLIDASKVIAESQKAGVTTKEVLMKTFGLVEPSTELAKPETEEPEEQSFWDKMGKKLGDNLDVFGQMGLAAVGPIADAVLQPGVAATVKGAAAAAQQQLEKKAQGRPAPQGQPGWQQPPKA